MPKSLVVKRTSPAVSCDKQKQHRKAAFDHPELTIPHGHSSAQGNEALDINIVLPAVGRNGGEPFGTFEEVLENGME